MSQSACPEQSYPVQSPRAWYQHRMMLLVVGIPLLSVVVSFTFLAIAIITFDGVVVDDYYKQGKEINRLLERDQMAQLLGMEAEITLSRGMVSIVLSAAEEITWPESVTLSILHPTQNGRDIKVSLQPASFDQALLNAQVTAAKRRYLGTVSQFNPGDWILQLETPNWRLTHRSHLAEKAFVRVKP